MGTLADLPNTNSCGVYFVSSWMLVLYTFITCITYLFQSCFCDFWFKYFINMWWECSIDLLIYLTEVDMPLFYRYFIFMCYMIYHVVYEIRTFICNPSFRRRLINFSTSASAISNDVACLSGTAAEYLVNKSCIVSIYEGPLSIVASNFTISINILSNAAYLWDQYSQVFTRTNFFNWQFRYSCTYFVFIFSCLTKNNYDEFFYKFLLCLYDLQ